MSLLFEPLPRAFDAIAFLDVDAVTDSAASEAVPPRPELPQGPSVAMLAEITRRAMRLAVEAEAEAQLRSDLEVERSAITHALAGFAQARTKYFAEMETEVVRLSLAVARQILRREVATDESLLRDVVSAALETLADKSGATLRVARSSVETWKRAGRLAGIEIVADDAMHAGELRLMTPGGFAELGIEAQFRAMEEGMLGEAAKRSA